MPISIVIPNHNRINALALTLETLCRQTCPPAEYEVIVVDQVSADGSRELVKNFAAPYELRLVEQNGQYGISVGRNGGIQAAAGELVILLDADILAHPGLVQAHADLHGRPPGFILGCGRLLPYLPAYTTFIEQVANPDACLDRGPEPGKFPFWFAFGGHLYFHVEAFRQVGPFKPELKGAEDIEFAYRAAQAGVEVENCPQAIGYHNHPRSLAERCRRAFGYWSMIPAFLDMHPELRGTIPGIAELEPWQPGRDDLGLWRSKTRAAFWSLRPLRLALYAYLLWAEKERALPRLAKFSYYRLILGQMRAGATQGKDIFNQLI